MGGDDTIKKRAVRAVRFVIHFMLVIPAPVFDGSARRILNLSTLCRRAGVYHK